MNRNEYVFFISGGSLQGGAGGLPHWLLLLLQVGHPLLRHCSSLIMEKLGTVLVVRKSPLIANRPIDYKLMDWLDHKLIVLAPSPPPSSPHPEVWSSRKS